jgi:hypothetical protein
MYNTTIFAPNLVSPSAGNNVVLMPATLRVYTPPSKTIVPNETLVIVDAKFAISAGPTGLLAQLDSLSFKPFNDVPGIAPDTVDAVLPDFKAHRCHLLGNVTGPVQPHPDGSRSFPMTVSDFVYNAVRPTSVV